MQTNVLRFNETAITTLSYLYNRFPAKSELKLPDLFFGDMGNFAEHVITWLSEEQLIRYSEYQGESFHDCILTAKGLAHLQSVVDDEQKITVIKKLKDCQENACFRCFETDWG